jgi:hypothetical protein
MEIDHLNDGNPNEDADAQYECTECGEKIEEEGVCSSKCWEASMR